MNLDPLKQFVVEAMTGTVMGAIAMARVGLLSTEPMQKPERTRTRLRNQDHLVLRNEFSPCFTFLSPMLVGRLACTQAWGGNLKCFASSFFRRLLLSRLAYQ